MEPDKLILDPRIRCQAQWSCLPQVTAPALLYQFPFLLSPVFWRVVSPFSHPIRHFAGSLGLFVEEWQMGPPRRITAVTRSHHHTHGRQINTSLLAHWVFPQGAALPAQWCSKIQCLQPTSPTSSALDWYQEDEPLFWCPPCRSAQSSGCWGEGPRDPLSPQGWAPGASVCPSDRALQCQAPSWNCWLFQFPDLKCLG